MKFLSLEPFVPSGNNFEGSKLFFRELGFTINGMPATILDLKKTDANSFCRNMTKKILQKILW
ncbi:MAG: hypothetical protein ACR2KX_07155 [Chitinophagaceae bacterium]